MKILRKSINLFFPVLFILPFLSFSQDTETLDHSNNKLVSVAREIMTSAGTCALITLDDEGRARVRAMDPFTPEEDLIVWFGTNSNSRKVDQIKKDPRVTLYYLDADASGYVMIYGIAELVDDQKEKEKRWKKEWDAFYPNKAENYLLIKVSPIWMEVSSTPRGIFSDTITWQPPIVIFDPNKELKHE